MQEACCMQPAQGTDLMHAPMQEACQLLSLDCTARGS